MLLRRLDSKVPTCMVRAFADDTAVVVADYVASVPVLGQLFNEFALISALVCAFTCAVVSALICALICRLIALICALLCALFCALFCEKV